MLGRPPADMRSGRGVLRRPLPQLKKIVERNVKTRSWNVGSMTGRGRELVEVCKRRNIGILCVQETKWTGKSARELGEGSKILYSGEKSNRNGVWVILCPEFKEKVDEVSRPSDRLVKLKLVIAGEIFNSICPSAYAPQSGETEKIKEEFLKDWEDLMSRVPRTEKIVVGADLNGHVGINPGVFQRVQGTKGRKFWKAWRA